MRSYNCPMDSMETVERDGIVYAHFFHADLSVTDSMRFVTQDHDPLQVGIFERDAGYEVQKHRHKERDVQLKSIGEFLWIQSGAAKVSLYDDAWNLVREVTVCAGDCAILLRGGHSLLMLEPTRFLEVKQGPYPGKEMDKLFPDRS